MSNRIAASLRQLFEENRLVFWYDADRDMRAEFDAIELPVLDPRQWVHRLAPRQVLGHLRRRLDPTPRNGG